MKTITATLYIASKPEAVWAALTEPAGVAALYFGSKLVTSFEPGAPYQYVGDDGTVHVLGEVLEQVPASRPGRLLFLGERLPSPRPSG